MLFQQQSKLPSGSAGADAWERRTALTAAGAGAPYSASRSRPGRAGAGSGAGCDSPSSIENGSAEHGNTQRLRLLEYVGGIKSGHTS